MFRGAAKIAGENVGVINIEHGSRGREGSGKTDERFILSGENKREKGNRGGRRSEPGGGGWWFRILSVVVACSPSPEDELCARCMP